MSRSSRPLVLYVEDREDWQETVQRALREDFDVRLESTYQDGKRAIEEHGESIAVAIVDLNLVDESDRRGGELVLWLAANFPSLPRMIVTGSPPEGRVRKELFEEYKVDDILVKGSFHLDDLRHAVHAAIEGGTRWDTPALKLQRAELRERLRMARDNVLRGDEDAVEQNERYYIEARKLNSRSAERARTKLHQSEKWLADHEALFSAMLEQIERGATIDELATTWDEITVRLAEIDGPK